MGLPCSSSLKMLAAFWQLRAGNCKSLKIKLG